MRGALVGRERIGKGWGGEAYAVRLSSRMAKREAIARTIMSQAFRSL